MYSKCQNQPAFQRRFFQIQSYIWCCVAAPFAICLEERRLWSAVLEGEECKRLAAFGGALRGLRQTHARTFSWPRYFFIFSSRSCGEALPFPPPVFETQRAEQSPSHDSPQLHCVGCSQSLPVYSHSNNTVVCTSTSKASSTTTTVLQSSKKALLLVWTTFCCSP